MYTYRYKTPKQYTNIIMKSNGEYLTGLWFEGSRNLEKNIQNCTEKELKIFQKTCQWLDIYFRGQNPDFTPEYTIEKATPFQKEVIEIMKTIPYGKTMTYNEIAKKIASKHEILKMSAQAVGGAVGRNPISIIIPCHRVVGTNGNLTGYGGGMNNKIALLTLEKVNITK